MFAKIVVGYDGSDTAKNAMRLACDLAQKYDSELHLVHTPQPHTVAFALGAVAGYHAATTMPHADEVEKAAAAIVTSARDVAKDCNQTITGVHTNAGEPADEIIAVAKSVGADLIVTGRRGLGGVGALVLGSTTQRVNHLAECACLSVT
ncbi:universal stress protein [uncultured Tateyamaria sp.]|uniref:universal stress protein n=1 Tax=Tateyamaria sp. TaxID=1929288 RepID=UPI00262DD084|nr:universal stress protein [uncultured Tateyamaria sp.]